MKGNRLFVRHLNEDDEEELVAIIHKHWMFGVQQTAKPALLLIGAGILLYAMPFRFIFIVTFLTSIAAVMWLVRSFYNYFLDVWIITDQGLIDVEWHGWFHRQSTRVLYSDIQGVSYEIQGVVGTLMHYGRINVEKISSGDEISLDHVPNPRGVEALILKQMEDYLHEKNLADAKHIQEVLTTVISREIQLEQLADEEEEDEDVDETDQILDEEDGEEFEEEEEEEEAAASKKK